MKALATAAGALLIGVFCSAPAAAHDRGPEPAGTQTLGALEPAPGRFYLRGGLGGGYVWSRLDAKGDELSLRGWAPSASLTPGVGLSRRFVLGLDIHGQLLPSGTLELAGAELMQRGSSSQLTFSLTPIAFTGRGWFLASSVGIGHSWLKIAGTPDYELDAFSFCAGLTLGWDGTVEDKMATGAALLVGYVHVFEKDDVTQDFLGLTMQIALTKY